MTQRYDLHRISKKRLVCGSGYDELDAFAELCEI